MKNKIVKLIISITRLSEKMKSVTKDLDRIADLLQDREILLLLKSENLKSLSTEDYE